MTLNDIYQKTKCWMFEKPSSNIYDNYVVEIANKVLAELFQENNMCRIFNGKEPFTDISEHQVSSLEDEVDYEDEYLLDVIPKGIDANFLMDDDLNKMSKYDTEYNNARVMHQKMISKKKIEEMNNAT